VLLGDQQQFQNSYKNDLVCGLQHAYSSSEANGGGNGRYGTVAQVKSTWRWLELNLWLLSTAMKGEMSKVHVDKSESSHQNIHSILFSKCKNLISL
jgi:hypothetical protein